MLSAELENEEQATVWKSLSDPTRRAILDTLRANGPMTTGALAACFELTRYGVMKHLKVLQSAMLIIVESRGRERWNRVNAIPIQQIYQRWMRPFDVQDADRALRFKAHVERKSPVNESTPAVVSDIVLEFQINAEPSRVWDALVHETASWWHPDFFTSSDAKAFHIEAKLGGLMFEDWGGGEGQVWGQVMGVKAPSYLNIVGDSSKEWGGPSRGIFVWKLEAHGGGTKVHFQHSTFGHVSETGAESLDSGWRLLFGDALKNYIETGKKHGDAS